MAKRKRRSKRTRSQVGKFSKTKGATYENARAKDLSSWAGTPKCFRRTPLSGGWDRKLAPGDLIRPTWFLWPLELKARESWTWETMLNH